MGPKIAFPLMAACVALAAAAPAMEATPLLPEYFIILLGIVLPFVYQVFICRLPLWAKPVAAYGISAAVAAAAGFLFAGWRTVYDLLLNLVWLFAVTQFVYDLLVRTILSATRRKCDRTAPVRPPPIQAPREHPIEPDKPHYHHRGTSRGRHG